MNQTAVSTDGIAIEKTLIYFVNNTITSFSQLDFPNTFLLLSVPLEKHGNGSANLLPFCIVAF